MLDIHDLIKLVNFGDDRLRGLWVAGGQILAFPIDFDRRPYSTVALPCECVIQTVLSYDNKITVSNGQHPSVTSARGP